MTASGASSSTTSPEDPLAARVAHLAALRSAWGVLAPAGVSESGDEVAASGRALTEHLARITESRSDFTPDALVGVDNLLAEFETTIRRVALEIPIAQLRSVLPRFRETHRRGLLDLLDVLIGEDPTGSNSIEARIGVVDYLVTLLCTKSGAAAGIVQLDPATLTPRLESLCAASDDPDDPSLQEVESEFFAAATMDDEALRQELQQRTLRNRKAELGMRYFAPRVLRAIVTYNATLLVRVADEIVDSVDWGEFATDSRPDAATSASSVFDSEPLRAIATAVRRRVDGDAREPNPIDAIAWALDLDYLENAEKKALSNETLGCRENPLGTAILVGLLSRSLAVLSIELQEAGIAPDDVSDAWVAELNAVFQEEINRHITQDAYKLACALSELKNRFLFAPLADQLRDQRQSARMAPHSPTHAPEAAASDALDSTASEDRASHGPHRDSDERSRAASERDERKRSDPSIQTARPSRRTPAKPESARDLVRDALEQSRLGGAKEKERLSWHQVPWARIAKGGAFAALCGLIAVVAFTNRNPDLERLAPEELEFVSSYLTQGERNGRGSGPAFVGTLDEAWNALPLEHREISAHELVSRLRRRGVNQIMIYDADDRIRIQALGDQPTRVL